MGALARAIALTVVVAGPCACTSTGAFECEADDQCQDGARLGRCESSGWCSFPDSTCDSGYKYGAHAGGGLAEACVDASLGSSGEPTTSVTSIGTTTAVDATGPGPLDGPDDATADSTTATATTEPLTSGSDETSTSASDATSEDTGQPVDPAVFIDHFDRPDDVALGNGWIEKHPTAFQLVDGRVVFESSASGFEDNMWYRDEAELDVEVCIDLQVLVADANNHPQVHARIQPDVVEPGVVSSYVLYVEDLSLVLVRLVGGVFQQEWSEPLPGSLEAGPWYRLCAIVVGTDPVQLEGRLWVEQAGGWTLQAELLALDDGAERITEPGATGSSAADARQVANLVYDDFVRTILAP